MTKTTVLLDCKQLLVPAVQVDEVITMNMAQSEGQGGAEPEREWSQDEVELRL